MSSAAITTTIRASSTINTTEQSIHYEQQYEHQLHNRHSHQKPNRTLTAPTPPPSATQSPESWLHTIPEAQRRHYRVYHRRPHNRWMPRHHYHHHHTQYSAWTAWSRCTPECVQRRERYCKTKRKCGHIRHIEERKCRR